jgi:hypothetical protein
VPSQPRDLVLDPEQVRQEIVQMRGQRNEQLRLGLAGERIRIGACLDQAGRERGIRLAQVLHELLV